MLPRKKNPKKGLSFDCNPLVQRVNKKTEIHYIKQPFLHSLISLKNIIIKLQKLHLV